MVDLLLVNEFGMLKGKYEDNVITEDQMAEIEETENTWVDNNGCSGTIPCSTWYTVYLNDESGNVIDEFDCYMKFEH